MTLGRRHFCVLFQERNTDQRRLIKDTELLSPKQLTRNSYVEEGEGHRVTDPSGQGTL